MSIGRPGWVRAAASSLVFIGCASGSGAAPDLLAQKPPPWARAESWRQWEDYASQFIENDGRVVDRTADGRSTSEGQAYGLVLALAAGDRARFEQILAWTEKNLAGGRLGKNLPAWLWADAHDGRGPRVLDENSASDADLWTAYALLEAGRLFGEPRFDAQGRALLATIVRLEVATVPDFGPVLLPGRFGFSFDGGARVRLNLSYLPPMLLRRFAALGLPGPWVELLQSLSALLAEVAPQGIVPDWFELVRGNGVYPVDPTSRQASKLHGCEDGCSSYDSIRNPLWAGMLDEGDGLRVPSLKSTRGLADWLLVTHKIPEVLRAGATPPEDGNAPAALGESGREGPPGFWAALLPSLHARGETAAADSLRVRLEQAKNPQGTFGDLPSYYDQNLCLFALGFLEGKFRFGADGSLEPRWMPTELR